MYHYGTYPFVSNPCLATVTLFVSWNLFYEQLPGDSSFAGTQQTEPPKQTEQSNPPAQNVESTYILNVNTKKFHYPSCSSVKQMSDKNKQTYTGSRADLISQGYDPCKKCNP